jgi:hypothetical protein
MTPQDFVAALERHVQLHGVPFSRADVQAFVESCWLLIEEDARPERWCAEFLGGGQTVPVD